MVTEEEMRSRVFDEDMPEPYRKGSMQVTGMDMAHFNEEAAMRDYCAFSKDRPHLPQVD